MKYLPLEKLRALAIDKLQATLDSARTEKFKTKMQLAADSEGDNSKQGKLAAYIAQILTVINEKRKNISFAK